MNWIKRHTSLVIFFVILIIGVFLAPHAGVTWDEPDNIFDGGVYVTFFREGLNPHAFDGFWDEKSYFRTAVVTINPTISHYPPVPNYVGSAIALISQKFGFGNKGWQIIINFHWATVLFLALLAATVYRFAILLGISPAMSLFAAIATYLYPAIFGHGLTDLKDTAQVSLFTLSLYYLVRGSVGAKRGVKDICTGAGIWGLAMATKFNAVYVPIVWGIWVIILDMPFVKKFRSAFSFRPPAHADIPKEKVKLDKISSLMARVHVAEMFLIVIVGLAAMYLVWPYLWFDPIGRFREVIMYFMTIGQGYSVVWNGVLYVVGVGKSLWWYPWASFLVTTPLTILALVFAGLGALVTVIKRKPVLLILPIWILVPFIRTISPWAAFYDEFRHFMEVIPACIIVAALALDWISKRWSKVALVLALGTLVHLLLINITYFPYSTGYYNMFAGNANVNFDRDIEGLSVKEGIDFAHGAYGHIRVFVPIAGHLSWYYLLPQDVYVIDPAAADTVVLMNKASHQIDTQYEQFEASKSQFTLAHTIKRGDAIFGWVYRRK